MPRYDDWTIVRRTRQARSRHWTMESAGRLMSFTCAARGALVAFGGAHGGVWLRAARGCRAPSGTFAITERAESGPITAMAVKAPFSGSAGGAGLRRFESRPAKTRPKTVAPASHPGARAPSRPSRSTTTARPGSRARRRGRPLGRRWRRLSLRAQGHAGAGDRAGGAPPDRDAKGSGPRGPGGLFRYDGRIFNSVDALYEVAGDVARARRRRQGRVGGDARPRPVPRRRRPRRAGAGQRRADPGSTSSAS